MAGSDNDGDPHPPPYLDAATLSGLLADDDRLRVVAALVLGADDVASVRSSTGLELPAIMRALQRLDDAGLVEREGEQHLALLSRAFQVAAR